MRTKTIKHIGIQCLKCKDKIFSLYRHNFRSCSCGEVSIDGGFDYTRIVGNEKYWKSIKKNFKVNVYNKKEMKARRKARFEEIFRLITEAKAHGKRRKHSKAQQSGRKKKR